MSAETKCIVDASAVLRIRAHDYADMREACLSDDPDLANAQEALEDAARAFVRAEQEQGPHSYFVTFAFETREHLMGFGSVGVTQNRPIRTPEDVVELDAYIKQQVSEEQGFEAPVTLIGWTRLEGE
jgi:hypothetical protein